MAILCRHHSEGHVRRETRMTLRKHKLPHQLRKRSSSVYDPAHDSFKVMTLHVSKGLEFPVVARLFYVGATRATPRLVIGASGGGRFAARPWAKGKT